MVIGATAMGLAGSERAPRSPTPEECAGHRTFRGTSADATQLQGRSIELAPARRSAQLLAYDEREPGPSRVHRADLDVHESERQRDVADDVLGDVGLHLRGLLGP